MVKSKPTDLLPALSRNKAFEKHEKLKEKRKARELQRENPLMAAKLETKKKKLALSAAKKESTKTGKKSKAQQSAARSTEKTKAPGAPGAAEGLSGTKKKKKKSRGPATVVANAPTGKETLVKKKARELVQAQRQKASEARQLRDERAMAARKSAAKPLKHSRQERVSAVIAAGRKQQQQQQQQQRKSQSAASYSPGAGAAQKTGDKKSRLLSPSPSVTPSSASSSLGLTDDWGTYALERTIRGAGGMQEGRHGGSSGSNSFAGNVADDAALYPPELAFYQDYAERKRAEAVSEDAVLERAHQYFKTLNKKERKLNVAASAYLKKMKAVNRRGGDKDGFRYVVPKNVKAVVKLMKQKERDAGGAGGEVADGSMDDDEFVDGDQLQSTFGGDGVAESSDKPMRRRRKRRNTFSDFYQFQVSKRWTRNAESFLNRGRAPKSLFEAKKKQRDIRKL